MEKSYYSGLKGLCHKFFYPPFPQPIPSGPLINVQINIFSNLVSISQRISITKLVNFASAVSDSVVSKPPGNFIQTRISLQNRNSILKIV